jgi:DsbC/DsbD-like thiol-disulfide interchange protein
MKSLVKIASLVSSIGLSIFLVITSHAFSASSQWEDLGGGKVRLSANLNPVNNKVTGVIEVQLEEGWSTYWRYPGSSGIPPRFDFSKSVAFKSQAPDFPAPSLITQPYGQYAGYKKKVSFPFEGEMLATAGMEINLDLLIGVCSEVCIPAQAQLQIKGSELLQTDPKVAQAVSFAKLSVPKSKEAEDIILKKKLQNKDALIIQMRHKKSFGQPTLFVEGPWDWYLLPAELMGEDDESATFKLDLSRVPKGTDVLSHDLRYTLVTGTSGIEIER